MWLLDNPATNAVDRAFIFSAVEERITAHVGATLERATLEKSLVSDMFNKRWTGKEPILRLIHTLVNNDEIKRTYLQRFDLPLDRMVLENRKTAGLGQQ